MKALYAWPGFTSKGVGYSRPERSAGSTKWNYWKLWNFALDGIFAFSSLPLRVWSYIGGVVGLFSLIYMVWNFLKTIFVGNSTPGYTTLICVILFLGAVQLISIGVLGEYIGRLTVEMKGRPVYIVSDVEGPLKQEVPGGMSKTVVGVTYNTLSQDEKAEKTPSQRGRRSVKTAQNSQRS